MANVSVSNTFVAGTTIAAADMNTNFTDLTGWLNNRNAGTTSWTKCITTGDMTCGGAFGVTGISTLTGALIASSTVNITGILTLGARISGNVLMGTETTARAIGGTTAVTQIGGLTAANSTLSVTQHSAAATGPQVVFGKSRAATLGDYTIVQNGDDLGSIIWAGADGTDNATPGASIVAKCVGTPGANDLPTDIIFSTTPDGTNAVAEGMRIASTGYVTKPKQCTFMATDATGVENITGDGTIYPAVAADTGYVFGTEVQDIGANYNASTGVFTAPVSGTYLFSASVGLAVGESGNVCTIYLVTQRSGTDTLTYTTMMDVVDASPETMTLPVTAIIPMTAADTAFVRVCVTGTTKTVDSAADATRNYFSGILLA